jgi:hypothetical protein
MATVMNRHRDSSRATFARRSSIQKVCIVLGYAFVLIGITGVVLPGLLGMHLSMAHNLIHLVSGGLALFYGYADNSRKAYTFAVAFGVVYGLLGLAGFLIGQPGYPGVGYREADQNLLRAIPNVLEFGTMDHGFHMILSAAFLGAAYVWKKNHQEGQKPLAKEIRTSDVSSVIDRDRRTNFEKNL